MSYPDLFEQAPTMKLKGAGHRRSHLGNIVEEFTCHAMGWKRLKISGQKDYCADAENEVGLPCEIKSVHCSAKMSGRSVIYDWRMVKDEKHAPRLAYAFFCYSATGQGKAKSLEQFLDRIAASSPTIVLVPAWVVRMDALREKHNEAPKKKTSKRCGYIRAVYCEGYRNLPIGPYVRNSGSEIVKTFDLWERTFTVCLARHLLDPWGLPPAEMQSLQPVESGD